MIKIPQTNILIVNTVDSSSSILYYVDISTEQSKVVNALKPNFFMLSMDYVVSLNQVIAVNSGKLILAEPYTLTSVSQISINQGKFVVMIKDTNYALVTLAYSQVLIFDVTLMKSVLVLDQSLYTKGAEKLQVLARYYVLKDGSSIVIVSNSQGIVTWVVDLVNFKATYNGYIESEPENTWAIEGNTVPNGYLIPYSEGIDFLVNSQIYLYVTESGSIRYYSYTEMKVQWNDTSVFLIYEWTSEDDIEIYSRVSYIEEDNLLLLPSKQVMAINSKTFSNYKMLYFENDGYSHRFMYEDNGYEFFYMISGNQLNAYKRYNFANVYEEPSRSLDYTVRFMPNSLFRVKNCYDCLFYKSGLDDAPFLAISSKIYPFDSPQTAFDLSNIGLTWGNTNVNIDVAYINDAVWMVLGYPQTTVDYLFAYTDVTNGNTIYLKVDQDDLAYLNSNQSSFAIFSLENTDNQEIIGVDLLGNVYIWDVDTGAFKSHMFISNCLNAINGEVFHYEDRKWLIVVSEANRVYVHDLNNDSTVHLLTLASYPLALRVFSEIGVVGIGDNVNGNLYIYKFNPVTYEFYFHMLIQTGKFVDKILWMELLKDKTLWISYVNSNLYFEIMKCYDDVTACQSCDVTFYIQPTKEYVPEFDAGYGQGTLDVPFTTTESILTSILYAYHYIEIIPDFKQVQVNLIVDSDYDMQLTKQLIEFSFSEYVKITIQSLQDNTKLRLFYSDILTFDSFSGIHLKGILLNFDLESGSSPKCGFNFTSITNGVVLENIELSFDASLAINCHSIIAEQSDLTIISYTIADYTFPPDSSLFEISGTAALTIDGLYMNGCSFEDSFTIVTGTSTLTVTMSNLNVQNSSCANSNADNDSVSLFSAGLFQVDNSIISSNEFCKKTLFEVLPSSSHVDYEFSFTSIEVTDNTFQSRASYVFLTSLYYMLTNPSHSLTLTTVTFTNNHLIYTDDADFSTSALIRTSMINTININQFTFLNHHDISLAYFDQLTTATLANIVCSNTEEYRDSISEDLWSEGCFHFTETQSIAIDNLTVDFKVILDSDLISYENSIYSTTTFTLTSSTFSNLLLTQGSFNTMANPLMISSLNPIAITIDSCNFTNNSLDGPSYALVYSTTAAWIYNYLGTVVITNTTITKSTSYSVYGALKISSSDVSIYNSTFADSSSMTSSSTPLLQGSFINLSMSALTISNCTFAQAFAEKGGFLYIASFTSETLVQITNTTFSEAYALLGGGAVFFDIQDSLLTFTCTDCHFNTILTLTTAASAIELSVIGSTSIINEITFTNSTISSIFGIETNYFISIAESHLLFSNITTNSTGTVESDYFALEYYYVNTNNKKYQATLVSATTESNVTLAFCNAHSLTQDLSTTAPLLLSIADSQVTLLNTTLTESKFYLSTIQTTNSNLTITNSTFENMSSVFVLSRITATDTDFTEATPSEEATASLIQVSSSKLDMANSTFNNIRCIDKNTCKGSATYLLSSNFSIFNTVFTDSTASFGGALFISDLNAINYINSTTFTENLANYGGGGVYIAGGNDPFELHFLNSVFTQNKAENGKGGAIYIKSTEFASDQQNIYINSTKIQGNSAKIGGGISQQDIYSKVKSDSTVQGNIATSNIGNDFIDYPSHLVLSNQANFLQNTTDASVDDKSVITINNFRSGATVNLLLFNMQTEKNDIIVPMNNNQRSTYSVSVEIDPTSVDYSKQTLRGQTTIYHDDTGYEFSSIAFVGVPGQSSKLLFTSSEIYYLQDGKYNKNYSYSILVNFRQCTAGERVNSYGDYTECSVCKEGTYSFDFQQCYDCPEGALCPGGSSIVPQQGYWQRVSNSIELIQCENLDENCVGGIAGDDSCYEGHIGALCEECDILGEQWGQSYGKSSKYSCVRCDRIKNNIWIIILLTLWTFLSMTLAIKGDIEMLEQKAAVQILKRHLTRKSELISLTKSQLQMSVQIQPGISLATSNSMNVAQEKLQENKSGIHIKMLTNYLQIIGSISTFNLSIPSGVIEIPQTVRQPLQQTMNQLDCALKDVNSDIPIIYLRLMFSMVIPFLYLTIFMSGVIVMYVLQNRKKQFPYYIITTSTMFLVIYVQPDLVAQAIALLSCRQIGDMYYILSNVSFECYTDEHKQYAFFFVLPVLIFLLFIIPAFLFWRLWKQKDQLDKAQVKLKYGFLYKEYTSKSFYWEFVKMGLKLAIILSLNFYSQLIVLKGLLVFMVITIYSILSLRFKPYIDNDINQIDVYSTNVCAISVLLGVFIYRNEFDYFVYGSFAIIALINVWFLVFIIKKIVGDFVLQLDELLQTALKKVIHKLPTLKKFQKQEVKKRQINPELKAKTQAIFRKLLTLDPARKQELVVEAITKSIYENNQEFFKSRSSKNILTSLKAIEPLKKQISSESLMNDEQRELQRAKAQQQQKEELTDNLDTLSQRHNKEQVVTAAAAVTITAQNDEEEIIFDRKRRMYQKSIGESQLFSSASLQSKASTTKVVETIEMPNYDYPIETDKDELETIRAFSIEQ